MPTKKSIFKVIGKKRIIAKSNIYQHNFSHLKTLLK